MVVVTVDAQFIFDLEQSAVEANSGLLWRGLGAPPWPGISGASEFSSGWVYKGKVKHCWCQEIIRPDWMPDGRVEEETAQSLSRVGGGGSQEPEPGHPPGAATDVPQRQIQGSDIPATESIQVSIRPF